MLLLSKMSFEECLITWKTRENRISLPRWKKKKKIEVQLVCSFSNEISFILIFILQQTTSIHSHSFNIIKSSKSKSKSGWEKKERKWISSTTIDQIENPIRLTRAWREYEQTTLTQLPAFTALYKCNEHPITFNAHSYPSHHFNTGQDLSHWCFRRQFNRAMSESGVHDKRSIQLGGKWPSTTPQMTIHYSSQSNSLQKKAK